MGFHIWRTYSVVFMLNVRAHRLDSIQPKASRPRSTSVSVALHTPFPERRSRVITAAKILHVPPAGSGSTDGSAQPRQASQGWGTPCSYSSTARATLLTLPASSSGGGHFFPPQTLCNGLGTSRSRTACFGESPWVGVKGRGAVTGVR